MQTIGIILIIIVLILVIVGIILTIYFVQKKEKEKKKPTPSTPLVPPTPPVPPAGASGATGYSFIFQDLAVSTGCGNTGGYGSISGATGSYFQLSSNGFNYTNPGITLCPGKGYSNEVFFNQNKVDNCGVTGAINVGWLTNTATQGPNNGLTVCLGKSPTPAVFPNLVSCLANGATKMTINPPAFTVNGALTNNGATVCYPT